MSDFTPNSKLRRWLLVGAGAVFVDLWLSTSSLLLLFLEEADEDAFTIGDALDLATIVPQILVLLTFLALAHEIRSLGLWRSSIAVFGTGWVTSAFVLTDTEEMGPWEIGVAVAVGVGAIVVLLAIASRPSQFREPRVDDPSEEAVDAAEETDAEESEDSESSGWGCLAMLPLVVVGKLIVRAFRKMDLEWGFLLLVAAAIALLGFLIWFGVVKLRLRRELGGWSAASGAADIGLVVAAVALIAHLGVLFVQLDEEALENLEFTDPRLLVAFALASGYTIIWKALMGVLFLAVRGRSSGGLLGEAPDPADRSAGANS